MRKVNALVLVLVLVSAFAVHGAGQADDGQITIGAAMASFSDKWFTFLHDGVREFDADHDDVTITMTDGNDDPAQQLSQVETLVTQGVDAILLVPVDISAVGPIIEVTKSAGIPLVVANRLPAQEFLQDIDVYVGSESIEAGILQGQWVVEALGGAGRVGIITGASGHEAAIMRTQGNEVALAGTDIEIVRTAEGRWDRARGLQIAENWFQSGIELDAILANNDEMAIGALLAAESMGLTDEDIIIAGVDATPDALEFMGRGLDVTVFQSAHGQGYGGAEAAYTLVKGEPVESMTWIPFELVTPENMADYQ